MAVIDLRSDTVTRPVPQMIEAMMAAPVGDDVYGEDPTVNALEEKMARMAGKEAGLFCSSGTQSNLLALMTHCRRGDEYMVGQTAHTYRYEGGGAAVLGSIQPQPLEFEADGTIDLAKAEQFIKPDDFHFAKTRLFCLENTQGGKVLPVAYLEEARRFVDFHGLGFHLDGARIFNAAVKLNVPIADLTRHFDTVSCCLSKGLGAPVGSVLCGPESFIKKARRWRKMLGGGMRQAGILAAAGIYALDHHIDRMAEDHENALALARGLADIDFIEASPEAVQTNMVFAHFGSLAGSQAGQLAEFLKPRDILIDDSPTSRMVTHLDITREDVDKTIALINAFYTEYY